nr:MAG: ORF1 [TTV-like mini virus]
MPWRRRYYQRRRRYWNRFWRPRKTIWRRRRRRRYYYRQPVRRKKLKYIILKELQPKCIHKCKIKGSIPLFWGPPERFSHNYELYELTTAPEKLPSGGLFGIKNFTLEALYAEAQYVRNIWTKTNNTLPLVKYTGCKLKFYRSLHVDYFVSYSTSLPLKANLDMYQSMHPGIHALLHQKITVTRKKYNHQKKPYKTLHIPPPNPLIKKWYLQHDLATLPLVQIRSSATSLDEYYINWRSVSTTISIFYLSPAFQNFNFKNNPPSGYHIRGSGTQTIHLYSNLSKNDLTENNKWTDMVYLGNTNTYTKGTKIIKGTSEQDSLSKNPKSTWGNPFYTDYLQKNFNVYYCRGNIATICQWMQKEDTDKNVRPHLQCTKTELTDAIRYNPFNDQGTKNTVWLQSIKQDTTELKPPDSDILTTKHLPLWVALHGFEDFQKKNHTVQTIDTDYMIICQANFRNPSVIDTFPIIDIKFIQGKSPYEESVNSADITRWYPCVQYQQTSITNITSAGPGSPKLPPLNSVEAKMDYTFYFKWGGNPPPMDSITDPAKQPDIHIPTNLLQTTSLQNPATRPESLLYNFDERRGYITKKALARLQKDWTTEQSFIADGSHFSAKLQTPETSTSEETTSEEEEEETQILLNKLRKQRLKHKRLKLKILSKMGIVQK